MKRNHDTCRNRISLSSAKALFSRRSVATITAFLSFAATTVCASAAPPHPSLPQPGLIDGLGVNIHFTDPRPGEVEMLAEAGFRWIRMDLTWGRIEREKGKYDFSAYDRLLKSLEPHKIRTLFILDYSNSLYEENRSVSTEEGRQAYARWATAAVKRYRGRGILWEIWNEPNISGFWKPEPNVDDYTAMALMAARAIREIAPDEAIIGPGTSRIDLEFIEGCCKAGLLEFWDAVSVHPYRQTGPETAAVEYQRLRRIIGRYAPSGKSIPILSGEWGYSAAWRNFNAEKQGKMLPREWLTNLSHEIPISIWYDWHDDGRNPEEAEHNFGTVKHELFRDRRPVYDPKPAYLAAKTLTSTLDGYRFSKRIAVGSHTSYALLFEKGAQQVLAVWKMDSEPATIKIPSRDSRYQRISHTGEERSVVSAKNGLLEVTATDSPVYLVAATPNAVPATVPTTHDLHAAITVGPGPVVSVEVDNLEDARFEGVARLVDLQGIRPKSSAMPLRLAAGETNHTLRFPLTGRPAGVCQVGLRIDDGKGNLMFDLPIKRVIYLSDKALTSCRVYADGDAKIGAKVSAVTAQAPEPLPDSNATVLRIDYQFEPGWKYLRLIPKSKDGRQLPGKPVGFAFWIYGDGQNTSPRLRVQDTTGQTWQPSGASINWKGWRYVELSLKSGSGHWGGANDGAIHYPLAWDSVFLLDNPGKERIEGSIYIAAPMVLY